MWHVYPNRAVLIWFNRSLKDYCTSFSIIIMIARNLSLKSYKLLRFAWARRVRFLNDSNASLGRPIHLDFAFRCYNIVIGVNGNWLVSFSVDNIRKGLHKGQVCGPSSKFTVIEVKSSVSIWWIILIIVLPCHVSHSEVSIVLYDVTHYWSCAFWDCYRVLKRYRGYVVRIGYHIKSASSLACWTRSDSGVGCCSGVCSSYRSVKWYALISSLEVNAVL